MLTLDPWQMTLILLGAWLCGPVSLWRAALWIRRRRRKRAARKAFQAQAQEIAAAVAADRQRIQKQMFDDKEIGPQLEAMVPHYRKFLDDIEKADNG